MESMITKLKLTKRALVGVVGVQGAGKSAAMRAIRDELNHEFPHSIVAVKVPESGGLRDALKDAVGDALIKQLDGLLNAEVLDRVQRDSAFYQRAIQLAKRMERSGLEERLHLLDPESGISVDTTDFYLPPSLHLLISKSRIRELEERALDRLLSERRVIMIDMPDYPKHDRRLIARDLDDIQGVWNHLMTSDSNVSIAIFIQKETFNYADHFFYGKMDLVDLIPLIVSQLLEAYKQKWSGYAPFTEDALRYVARMSRGVFRRFKRYIALALEPQIAERAQADISSSLIDLEAVKKSVTDEEVMRGMDKEFDSIFRRREQKEKTLQLIKLLSGHRILEEQDVAAGLKKLEPYGIAQNELAERLDLSEMVVSRLVRELEQHGYIKRTPWRQWTYVDMNW
jgi:dephospho-CoA kinase